jgi:hypothetical protein
MTYILFVYFVGRDKMSSTPSRPTDVMEWPPFNGNPVDTSRLKVLRSSREEKMRRLYESVLMAESDEVRKDELQTLNHNINIDIYGMFIHGLVCICFSLNASFPFLISNPFRSHSSSKTEDGFW